MYHNRETQKHCGHTGVSPQIWPMRFWKKEPETKVETYDISGLSSKILPQKIQNKEHCNVGAFLRNSFEHDAFGAAGLAS